MLLINEINLLRQARSWEAEALADFEPAFSQAIAELGGNAGAGLRAMLAYHNESKGKRLRPVSVALAHEMSARLRGGDWQWQKNSPALLPFMVCVELLHNATLLHDDLQDGDEVRRGRPTLWKKYSPAQAINAGDFLFFAAPLRFLRESLANQSPLDAKRVLDLLDLCCASLVRVIEGQAREFELKEDFRERGLIPTLAIYREMVAGKTAALFELPILGGLMLATKADANHAVQATQPAAQLGVLFQVADDWIDLWGNKGRGQIGNDIAEGKLSYPVLLALNLASEPERERLRTVVAKSREETSAAEVLWALSLLEKLGIKEQVRQELLADFSSFSGPWAPLFQTLAARFLAPLV